MNRSRPNILFEDNHLVVLSKPAGLLSQGEITGGANLVDWLRLHFGRNYVGLIHRLDRNTSGLMVVAKRTKAASRLSESLKEGALKRIYQAIIYGNVEEAEEWRDWLVKDSRNNKMMKTNENTPGAVEAVLRITPIKQLRHNHLPLTLAEYELQTGRSHQIRIQSALKGHPLLGDIKYQEGPSNIPFPRPALHSVKIKFPHPMSQELMFFEDALPQDMQRIVEG